MSLRIIYRLAPPLAGVALLTGVAPAFAQGTEEERRACTPDVMRLCREYIPEVRLITQCLIVRREELSPDCKLVMRPPHEKVAATTTADAPKARVAATAKPKKRVASTTPSLPLLLLPVSLLPPASIPQQKAAKPAQTKKNTTALPKSSATAPKATKKSVEQGAQ